MASLIGMRLSDLSVRVVEWLSNAMRSRHFWQGKPLGTGVPQDENLPTCARWPSNHQRTRSWGVKLIGASRSKQLGHQGRYHSKIKVLGIGKATR